MIEIPNPNPINNKNNVNLNTYIFLIEVIKMEEFIENKESNKMKITTRTTRNNSDKNVIESQTILGKRKPKVIFTMEDAKMDIWIQE